MISKPHKKHYRSLTPLESLILKSHFEIHGDKNQKKFIPVLKVDQQTFAMGHYPLETSEDASWFCRQMAYALARMVWKLGQV